METEGVKEAKGKDEADHHVEGEDEEEFLDQFGNIKEDKPSDDSEDGAGKENVEKKDTSSQGRGRGGERGRGRGRGESERGKDRGGGEGGRGRGEKGGRGRGRGDHGESPQKGAKSRKERAMPGQPGWRDLDSEIAREVEEQADGKRERAENEGGGFQRLLAPAYPEFSNLSWIEQDKYLLNLVAYQEGGLGPSREVDWQYFQNFQQLVNEERQEFVQFTSEALKTLPTPTIVSAEHRRYATEFREARLGRALQLPRHWEKVRDIRLAPAHPAAAAEMRLQQNLAELGRIPKAVIPVLLNHGTVSERWVTKGRPSWPKHPKSLPGRYPRIANNVPVDPSLAPGGSGQSRGEARMARHGGRKEQEDIKGGLKENKVDTDVYLHKVPVTQDPNAEKLARLLAPQVFISASALCCLMDNHAHLNYSRSWIIPITIRSYNCQGSVVQKKVIFFGKPLPPRTVTNADLAKISSKAALATMLFTPEWHQQASRERVEKASSVFAPEEEEDLFGGSSIALDDLEVFGVERSEPSIKEKFAAAEERKETKKEEVGDASKSEESQNVKDDVEGMETLEEEKEKLSQLDGALSDEGSSDSEADNLVMAIDEPETPKEEAPRRSSRRSQPTMKQEQIVALALGKQRGRKNSSRSNTDQEDESLGKGQRVKKKSNVTEKEGKSSGTGTPTKKPLDDKVQVEKVLKDSKEEIGCAAGEEVKEEEEVKAEPDDEKEPQQHAEEEEDSSSDSGDDDEAMRQLYMQKMQQAQTLKESSIDMSIDDQDSRAPDSAKDSQASQKESTDKDLSKKPSKEPTSSDLFGSEVDTGSEEDECMVSPAKKIRPIDSSSDEELRKKLAGLGKEAADVKEVKRKVAMTKKLKGMEKRREGRAALEEKERKARLGGRQGLKEDMEESSEEEKLGGRRGRIQSSDDDDEEESESSRGKRGRRFNKFETSDKKRDDEEKASEGVGLLDNLLDSQQSMLKKEERRKEGKKGRKEKEEHSLTQVEGEKKSAVLYKGELLHSVGEGLGEGSEYQPPAPHTNLSYRLWNLGWKSSNAPPMQVQS